MSERAYIAATQLALNREGGGMTDEQYLDRNIPPVVAFIDAGETDADKEFRIALLHALYAHRPKARPTVLVALAEVVLATKDPKVVEEKPATAVPDPPSKPSVTVKKTSKKGATRKKTAG